MIRLIKPFIRFDDIREDFAGIFESGWLTKGPWVDRFRSDLSAYTGANNCSLTTSATTALTMSLKAIGIGPGDEIIISDFSFPASSNVVEDLGAKPVFADVDIKTFNATPESIEQKITDRTKAVMFVDALGNPAGVHSIKELCLSSGLLLIEDAACGLGSSELGDMVGSVADFTCLSFHPRKLLTTGEGGAILFNNSEYEDWFQRKLSHGAVSLDGKLEFSDFGYNYRLPDLQCAMGVAQLKTLDDIVSSRQEQRKIYLTLLTPAGYVAQYVPPEVHFNVQSMVLQTPEGVCRDKLVKYLLANGIESTIGTYSLSNTLFNRERYDDIQTISKYLYENTISLPLYSDVDVEYICDMIRGFPQ